MSRSHLSVEEIKKETLNLIKQYHLCNKEEKKKLLNRILELNSPLVAYHAKRYTKKLPWLPLKDLFQEGMLGIIDAVKNFDPKKNIQFSTYASYRIRMKMLQFIKRFSTPLTVGYHLHSLKVLDISSIPSLEGNDKIAVQRVEIPYNGNGLNYTFFWIPSHAFNSIESYSLCKQRTKNFVSNFLEKTSTRDDVVEQTTAWKEFCKKLRIYIRDFYHTLREKEKIVFSLILYTDTPLTLEEVGNIIGVSKERVRQIRNHITKKLKAYLKKRIPDFENYRSLLT